MDRVFYATTGTFEAWVRPSQFTLLELTDISLQGNPDYRPQYLELNPQGTKSVREFFLTGALPLSYFLSLSGR